MPIKSKFGTDYSKYLNAAPDPLDAFQNPANEGQRIQNARGWAERAGDPIGAGELRSDGKLVDPDRGFGRAVLSKPQIMAPLVLSAGLIGGGGLGQLGSLFGGGGGGASASATAGLPGGMLPGTVLPLETLATSAAPTAAATTAGGGATKMGLLGTLGKLFGKGGLDPTMLAMLGLSAFGGGDEDEGQRQSFRGTGMADPVNALNGALSAISRAGQGLASRGPGSVRNSVAPRPPAPVNIPGLPFQIGGGLGHDPALDDPTLLMGRDQSAFNMFDPFQSVAQQQMGGQPNRTAQPKPTTPASTPTKRRNPV